MKFTDFQDPILETYCNCMLNINSMKGGGRKKELVCTKLDKNEIDTFLSLRYKLKIDMSNINQWRIQNFLDLGHQLSFYLKSRIPHVEFIKSKGRPCA